MQVENAKVLTLGRKALREEYVKKVNTQEHRFQVKKSEMAMTQRKMEEHLAQALANLEDPEKLKKGNALDADRWVLDKECCKMYRGLSMRAAATPLA